MDGLRNPIGEEPPEVYWKRRLIVGIAIVIAILVIWFIIAKATGGGEDPAVTPDPEAGVSASPDPSGEPASAVQACGPSDVTITTVANPADVPAGALPVFDANLAQDGASACMIDTAAKGTELLVTSGSDRIYSSTDCAEDNTIATTQLILQPGATENLSVTWNRQRSLPDCATVTAEPGAGTYKAKLTIQGIESEEATFRLE